MRCRKAIFLLIALSIVPEEVSAGCGVVNRFIGVDSGDFIGMSFKYDLTVQSGTTQADVKTRFLPAIEKALARKIAPLIIPACAPSGTDTSNYPDVVGLDLDPKDTISGACANNAANRYTINGKVSIYVSTTAKNVASYFNFGVASVLGTLKTGTLVDLAIVSLGNFKSVKSPTLPPSPSPTFPPSPRPTFAKTSLTLLPIPSPAPKTSATTARPTLDTGRTGLSGVESAPSFPPKLSENDKTLFQRVSDLKNDVPVLFYFAIGSIVFGILVAIIGGCYYYQRIKYATSKVTGRPRTKTTKK